MDKRRSTPCRWPPAALPAWPFSPPASTPNSPAAPARTPAWAMRPSGPTASATPPTAFLLNGVDASNLFNGKSTSQVAFGARHQQHRRLRPAPAAAAASSMSLASIYLSIGNAIPTPAPETLAGSPRQRFDVRRRAGLHFRRAHRHEHRLRHQRLCTAPSTATAAPTGSMPRRSSSTRTPTFPPTIRFRSCTATASAARSAGPSSKTSSSASSAYQHLHVSDQEIGDSLLDVPVGLNDSNRDPPATWRRSPTTAFGTSLTGANIDPTGPRPVQLARASRRTRQVAHPQRRPQRRRSPTAAHRQRIHPRHRPLHRRSWPWPTSTTTPPAKTRSRSSTSTSTIPPSRRTPTPAFPDSLSISTPARRSFSITNTLILKSNLSTTQTLGVLREKNWGDNEQAFGPDVHSRRHLPAPARSTCSGRTTFPASPSTTCWAVLSPQASARSILNIGPNAEGQSANTGVFQNRLAPSGNAIWMLGKHTLSFGASYSYTQLNTIDKRTGTGTVATDDFSQLVQGYVTPGSSATGFYVSFVPAGQCQPLLPRQPARHCTCRTSTRSRPLSRSPPAFATTGTAA